MIDTITYELPLHERIRTLLRLDFLAAQFAHFAKGTTGWDSQAAVDTLLNTLVLVERTDLRGELLKELERQVAVLALLERVPGVDIERLQAILDDFDLAIDCLKAHTGPLAPNLRADPLLLDVQNRIALPAGVCDFDLPLFHAWRMQTEEQRHADLKHWTAEVEPVWRAVELLLHIFRSMGTSASKVAEKGVFQITFSAEQPCQLVQVILPSDLGCYPMMSGDYHQVHIRFMSRSSPPVQVQVDVPFQLVCCTV